jgi:uncharacterized membrane protein HdeD (DUF308 family)
VTEVRGERAWLLPVARSVVAIAVALAITFTADHSPVVGFVSLGAFGVLSGAIILVGTIRLQMMKGARALFRTIGVVFVVAGVLSLVFAGSSLAILLVLMSSVFALTGVLELVAGLNRRHGGSRDWIFVGALGALFGLIVLFIPVGFFQEFTGPDGVTRALTASVILVGAFGAYAAILGVYLVIAGLSLKWSGHTDPKAVGDS